ncbi:GLOBIN domain-containing protein [Salix suchowensis]|nr:GLOBIN domain-containing protein [Salix suchowensis]
MSSDSTKLLMNGIGPPSSSKWSSKRRDDQQNQSLAKLRMHTDSTVTYFDNLTTELGQVMRDFEKFTCTVKKHIVKSKIRPGHNQPSHTQHDSNVLPSAAAEELDVPPECHFVISPTRSHPLPLSSFLKNGVANPARKLLGLLTQTSSPLFGCLRKESFSASDLSLGYTGGERNTVRILGNKIFSVQTMCINFTSYDIRQDQDCLNPRMDNRDIMLYAPDGDDDNYWYARVLGIFHAKVLLHGNHSSISQQPSHIEFLWVRWFGSVSGYHGGMHQAKLPKVGFVKDTVSNNNYAFGFLDPSLVLQACHLIPDFPTGRTNDRLASYPGSYARHPDETNDWAEFYVNIFVDRDMCMRYFPGSGIGHCIFSTQLLLDRTNQDTETEVEEGEIELPMAESDSDHSDHSDISSGTESVYSDDDELDVEAQYGFDSFLNLPPESFYSYKYSSWSPDPEHFLLAYINPKALRCETCDKLRKDHNHNLPSVWYRDPEHCHPSRKPGMITISSELVLLYCGLTAFRQLQRKLDNETAELREMVNRLGAGPGGMDMVDVGALIEGVQHRVCRIEQLAKEMASLSS